MRSPIYLTLLLILSNDCALPSSAHLASRVRQDAIVLE